MGKIREKFRAGGGLRSLSISGTGLLAICLILCLGLVLNSCTTAPTKREMVENREKIAKDDLQLIKPPGDIDFSKPLTLEDAIRFGLRNNLEIRIADFNREISSKDTLAERLRMLPGLNAEGRYEYRDKLRKSDVYNWKTDTDQKDYTVSELKDSGKAGLTLTWNILDTIIAYVRSGAMEMHEGVLTERRQRQAQFLALDITEAYWQAAAVEDALDYVHMVNRKLRKVKQDIEESVKLRALDVMDATEAEMRLKELELTIRRLQADLSKSRLKLGQLMGLNQNVEFTLYRPPIKPIISALPHPRELDVDRLEEHALTHRPDLFESDLNVLIQKEQAKSEFLKLFPGVSFFAGYNYDQNRLLYSNTWSSAGAGLAWNLLNLPSQYAKYKGTKKGEEMAKAQRLMTTVGVITQVHMSLLDYAIKVDRFRLLDETYVLAANLLDMAKEKNQFGKLPKLAVTQRHLEEMAAKLRRDESVVDMLVAHKRLCVTIGVDPLDCDSVIGGHGGGETAPLKRWKCTECGYIHTGPYPPDRCPICGADRNQFIEYDGEPDDLVGGNAGSGAGLGAQGLDSDLGLDSNLDNWGASEPIRTEDRSARSANTPGWAGDASDRFLWKVQVGAFARRGGAAKRMDEVEHSDLRLMDLRDADVESKQLPGIGLINRVRFKGLTQPDAKRIANELKQKGMEYWILPPHSSHW